MTQVTFDLLELFVETRKLRQFSQEQVQVLADSTDTPVPQRYNQINGLLACTTNLMGLEWNMMQQLRQLQAQAEAASNQAQWQKERLSS